MNVRSIRKKQTPNPFLYTGTQFPKEKDGLIYVRQSSIIQVQTNIHSFEMQTEKFLEYFRDMGCTGNIEIVADDEALSGTLDIHKMPGLSRVMKTITEEKIGWIGAVAVNRLTRDPWLVKPGTIMKECYTHNVWIVTLRMPFNFKDPYCQRVFMIEAEESARHLEWMRLVLGGGKSAASDKGYYDGRYIVPGYIVDRTDPLRKKYRLYRPHAEVVAWMFQRFFELDGDFPQLCREVEAMPYVFEKFENWVDSKTVSKFSLHRKKIANRTHEGHYRLYRHGLETILTNPVYMGWWIPQGGGLIEQNHEPIVDEVLFLYAHKRLSTHTLEGERQKPGRVIRHSKVEALLKKVIKGPDGIPIYPSSANRNYTCREHRGRLILDDKFAISIQVIDTVFLERFFHRVQSIDASQFQDWEDTMERKRAAQEESDALIRKSISEAALKMKRINELLTRSDLAQPLPASLIDDLVRQYAGLETKKAELELELQGKSDEEDEDTAMLYEIQTLIPRIVQQWDLLPFEKRLRFIGALVSEVILSRVAPSWWMMEIHWKIHGWETDIAHIRRGGGGKEWSTEEMALLRSMYPTEDAADILQALPTRNWQSIKQKAEEWNISRTRRGLNSIPVNNEYFFGMSWEDLEYVKEQGLILTTKNVQWCPSPSASHSPSPSAIPTHE